MGMQCRICGKVFSRNQTLPFHRHLATHDTEPETECSCSNCTGKEPLKSSKEPIEKDPLEVNKKKAKPKGNIFKKMQTLFNDETDEEESDDEDAIKPFECGMCNQKFSTVQKLEKCITNCSQKSKKPEIPKRNEAITAEVIDEIADEFANEVANMEAKSAKKSVKKTQAKMSNSERNWQECPDRNWAAEFGYGNSTSVGPTKDILSKMAKSFKLLGDDEDSDEQEQEGPIEKSSSKKNKNYDSGVSEDEVFRTRGFKGTVKASLNRAPRTLSSSSLRTRKRMEALMRRAREFMKKDKKTKNDNGNNEMAKEKPRDIEKNPEPESIVPEPAVPEPAPQPETIVTEVDVLNDTKIQKIPKVQFEVEEDEVEDEEDEEDFDEEFDGISDEDEDDTDGLLIPLENGWVCEKRLTDPKTNAYSTHFWSPDGHRHSSLSAIKSYGNKKKLKLNLVIFERALKNNPHK